MQSLFHNTFIFLAISTCKRNTTDSRKKGISLNLLLLFEGEELLLQCEVSGDPDPRMAWRRNGSEVSIDEDEVFTSYRDGVARLRLRDVQPQHAGEYVCVASNDAGTVQCSSRVTVKGEDSIFDF